jgi:hypothetical protein
MRDCALEVNHADVARVGFSEPALTPAGAFEADCVALAKCGAFQRLTVWPRFPKNSPKENDFSCLSEYLAASRSGIVTDKLADLLVSLASRSFKSNRPREQEVVFEVNVLVQILLELA